MYAAAGGVPRVISNTGDASEYGGKTFYIFSPVTLLTSQHSVVGVHARHDDNRGIFSMDVF
jgi:hypothetical protein